MVLVKTIRVSAKTARALDRLKLSETETYDLVIIRLLKGLTKPPHRK